MGNAETILLYREAKTAEERRGYDAIPLLAVRDPQAEANERVGRRVREVIERARGSGAGRLSRVSAIARIKDLVFVIAGQLQNPFLLAVDILEAIVDTLKEEAAGG